MRRSVPLLLTLALASAQSFAESGKLILFLQGRRIGQMSFVTSKDKLAGKPANKSVSSTVINTNMLGSSLVVNMASTTWTDNAGKVLRMIFNTSSGGRSQHVVANFGKTTAKIEVNNEGVKTTRTLNIPKGAPLVDDPLTPMMAKGITGKADFYVLDPTSVTFIKNSVVARGPGEVTIGQNKFKVQIIDIIDPRVSSKVYIGPGNVLLKVDGPMGMEMYPEKLAPMGEAGPVPDLASLSSIPAEGNLGTARRLSRMKVRIEGQDLKSLPSDEFQTITPDGDAFTLEVHPPSILPENDLTIANATKTKPEFVAPGLNIPSNSPTFVNLANKILKGEKRVTPAALAIKNYVHGVMHPNAGIGVVRDASEVLKTKEGVCRDYAIVTVTLLRAAKIPSRLATGLVAFEGKFYYHAWAEAWDGTKWIGVDSTLPEDQIHAGHIKLAQGGVEEAYTFVFLDKVKIKVIDFDLKISQ